MEKIVNIQHSTANIQTLERLETILGFAEGHTLLFARCNAPTLRDQLIASLIERLTTQSVTVYRLTLSESTHDLREQIKALLPTTFNEDEPAILIITGLEYSIPYETPEAPMLAELNLGRELLQLAAPLPILFWLPDYAITSLTRYALDFWSWRSGLFEFETDRQHHELSYQQYVVPDQSWVTMNNLSLEQKLRRRRILEGLLVDYQGQIDTEDGIERVRGTQQEFLLIYKQLAHIHVALQEYNQAQKYYKNALKLAERIGDTVNKALILNNLGYIYNSLGEKMKALNYFNLALHLRQRTGDKGGEATTLTNMGAIYNSLDKKEEAIRYYDQALLLLQQVGDKACEATTLTNIGAVYSSLGEKERALHYYNLALPLQRQVGDKRGEAATLNNMGHVYNSLKEKDQALHYYNLALSLTKLANDKRGEAAILNNLGLLYYSMGENEEALRYYILALPLQQQLGDVWQESMLRHNIALVHRDRGELIQALEQLEHAVATEEKVDHPNLEADRVILEEVRAMLADQTNA